MLHTCFSKRRHGLYKKANELSVLTGASIAVVVFSPSLAGKPYSLGYPSVTAVLEGYTDPASYVPPTVAEEASLVAAAREFERERDRLDEATKVEKHTYVALDEAARAGVWIGDDDKVRLKEMPELVAMLAALERVRDEVKVKLMHRAHEVIAVEVIMMQQCAAAAAASDAATGAFQFEYPGAGVGAFADGVSGGSYYQEAMDTQMMLMGGNVVSHGAHASLPFSPMLLPSDLPPQPHFNYGSDYNNVAGYDLVDGTNHGAAYEMEGYGYGTRTPTTCNFFG